MKAVDGRGKPGNLAAWAKGILGRAAAWDPLLWFSVLGLYGLGLAGLWGLEASFEFSPRALIVQCAAGGMGLCAMAVLSLVDYRWIARQWKWFAPLLLGMVLLTFWVGFRPAGTDDRAWLPFFGTGLTIQPTEFLKVGFLLTFSLHLSRIGKGINRPSAMGLALLHAVLPPVLAHFQGDDGAALVFALTGVGMLLGAGISWKWKGLFAAGFGLSVPFTWFFLLHQDQRDRILSLFSSGEQWSDVSYQQNQGLLALRQGGLWGIGLNSPAHVYVPEAQNDFILTFLGESLGILGFLVIVALLALLCWRIGRIGFRCRNKQGKLLCLGCVLLLGIQTVLNVGMCLKILPVVGITLPFVSAGGSSLLALFCVTGLVMSVGRETRQGPSVREGASRKEGTT